MDHEIVAVAGKNTCQCARCRGLSDGIGTRPPQGKILKAPIPANGNPAPEVRESADVAYKRLVLGPSLMPPCDMPVARILFLEWVAEREAGMVTSRRQSDTALRGADKPCAAGPRTIECVPNGAHSLRGEPASSLLPFPTIDGALLLGLEVIGEGWPARDDTSWRSAPDGFFDDWDG